MALPLMRDSESVSPHPGGKLLGEDGELGEKGEKEDKPATEGVPGHRALSPGAW